MRRPPHAARKRHARALTFLAVAAAVAGAAACGRESAPADEPAAAAAEPRAARVAVARLSPLGGSGVTGTVQFTRTDDGVHVEAHVNGLEPGSRRGFHVHEWGDCSDPEGLSAGAHFNPGGGHHGGPRDGGAHAGDLGNLVADAAGHAQLVLVTPRLAVADGRADVVGRSVIVHAAADDLTTQPTGDSGARVACGVVVFEGAPPTPVLPPAGG